MRKRQYDAIGMKNRKGLFIKLKNFKNLKMKDVGEAKISPLFWRISSDSWQHT
jgi:hypothetical protein